MEPMRAFSVLIVQIVVMAGLLLATQPPMAQGMDPQAIRRLFPACAREPVPDDHEFVAVTAYEGDTLANVLVGSDSSQSTILRVSVTHGNKPVTVLVSGHSGLIWDFEGDVDRVRRVIATSSSNDGGVAVRGIPADRVEFPVTPNCQLSYTARRAEDLEAQKRQLAIIFGRPPDRAAYEYSAHELVLPQATWRRSGASIEALPFNPGGFRELDPTTLVSPVAITVPETYPAEAGLRQLERSGAIRRPRPEEIAQWIEGASRPYRSRLSPNYRLGLRFDYVITRDIMLPAGLYGAHLKKFLVLAGVPAPRGHPGHSCVAFTDDFRVSSDLSCFGEERSAIEQLRTLPVPEGLACRLLDPPADAAFEAVSTYEPDGAKHSFGSTRIPTPIDIRVLKPGDVVLVLNTYEPATWRVSFSPQTRIVGVLLSGYYTSTVEGIHPDTPVIVLDYEGQARRSAPAAACAPFLRYLGTAYNGGPDALVLDRQVQALTGRSLDRLRGDYKLKEVEIR